MYDHDLVEVGKRFITGDGVKADKKRGIKYLNEALTAGSVDARVELMNIYAADKKYKEVINLFEELPTNQSFRVKNHRCYVNVLLELSLAKPKTIKENIEKIKALKIESPFINYNVSRLYTIKGNIDHDKRMEHLKKAHMQGFREFEESEFYLLNKIGVADSFAQGRNELASFFDNMKEVSLIEKNKSDTFAKEIAITYLEQHPNIFKKGDVKKIKQSKIPVTFYLEYQPLIVYLSEISGMTVDYSFVVNGNMYQDQIANPNYQAIKEAPFLLFNRGEYWVDDIVRYVMDSKISKEDTFARFRFMIPNMNDVIKENINYAKDSVINQAAKEVASDGSKHPTVLNCFANRTREWQVGYFVPFYFFTFQLKKDIYTIRISGSYEAVDLFINNQYGVDKK